MSAGATSRPQILRSIILSVLLLIFVLVVFRLMLLLLLLLLLLSASMIPHPHHSARVVLIILVVAPETLVRVEPPLAENDLIRKRFCQLLPYLVLVVERVDASQRKLVAIKLIKNNLNHLSRRMDIRQRKNTTFILDNSI